MKGALTLKPKEDLKEGEWLTGYNTEVFIGDQRLEGVKSIVISYRPDQVVIAEIALFSVREEITGACPFIIMNHPVTGERARVMKIEFDDGSVVDFK